MHTVRLGHRFNLRERPVHRLVVPAARFGRSVEDVNMAIPALPRLNHG
jgi:plasmid stability protein